MNSVEATNGVLMALESAGVPYMLVGSLATNYYGVARSTKDADVVVQLGDRRITEVTSLLGAEYRLDPQVTFETVTGTTRYVIDVAGIVFRIELFRLSNDAHDRERFNRRLQAHLPDLERPAYIPTAEDVVITKLRWLRRKDIDDVRDVLSVQAGNLDFDYIHRWCDQHGTRAALEEIRKEVPEI